MENKRPELNLENQSVISQYYYKIAHGEIISELEATNDKNKTEELKAKLAEVKQKIDFFHVLNNAVSIADTVLHNEIMIDEFRVG